MLSSECAGPAQPLNPAKNDLGFKSTLIPVNRQPAAIRLQGADKCRQNAYVNRGSTSRKAKIRRGNKRDTGGKCQHCFVVIEPQGKQLVMDVILVRRNGERLSYNRSPITITVSGSADQIINGSAGLRSVAFWVGMITCTSRTRGIGYPVPINIGLDRC
jgi:hypothetical protein